MNNKEKLILDIEEIKDKIYNQSDISGYFILMFDEKDNLICNYNADNSLILLKTLELVVLNMNQELLKELSLK